MRTVRVACAVIKGPEGLLARRRAKGEQAGGWEFPGGKVEGSETTEEALRREVAEELGCALQLVWPYDTVEFDYPDFHLSMDAFVCTLAPGAEPKADPNVHSELRWVDREALLDVAWLPADDRLAESLGLNWDAAFDAEPL